MKLLGPRLLDKHQAGGKLTRKAAMTAKCADCMNRYVDGSRDCHIPRCPLYPWMPYRDSCGPKRAGTAEQPAQVEPAAVRG